jgi:CHAT domain-containing protein/tetratricopeptide (TPR) repeat protein
MQRVHWRLCAFLVVAVLAVGLDGPCGAAQTQSNASVEALNKQVVGLNQAGRYGEAVPLAQRALTFAEQVRGRDHPDVGDSLNNLAELYRVLGHYAEAEPLYKRAIAIWEKAFGLDDPAVAVCLNNLALLYKAQGRYAEAKPLYKRALAIWEKSLGPEHPNVGTALDNLAELYRAQGRFAEAEPLYKRSLAIRERTLGPGHPYVAMTLNNLALLYDGQGRYAEAEPLFKAALASREKSLGANHPDVAGSLNNLAEFYRDRGQPKAAEPLYRRALAIWEKAQGPRHPNVATALNNLANLYLDQTRYTDAELYYKRALAIRQQVLSPDHPDIGGVLNNLAWLAFERSDWAQAIGYWRQSTDLLIGRSRRGGDSVGQAVTGKTITDAERESYRFAALVKAAHRSGSPNRLAREMFKAVQWARTSDAASSLAQMAARTAAGNDALGQIVRERQDLVGEWQSKDMLLTAARSEPPAVRDAAAEQALTTRLGAIDGRLAEVDKRLARDFAGYSAFARPEPISVEEVQALLHPDEVLTLFLDTPAWKPTPEETFIWVVTKTDLRWVRSGLGTRALTEQVAALRCGLDANAWRGDRCPELLKSSYTAEDRASGKPLPFDTRRAHALYQALFSPAEDLIKGKHLLLVASGPLTALPFHVLVTEPPAALADYAKAAWLGLRQPITVLPSVASLQALRTYAKASHASRPFIGFGDPLLDGDPMVAWQATRAKQAHDNQRCSDAQAQVVALAAQQRDAIKPPVRGGLADVADIKGLLPLPETTDELCAVARSLGVPGAEVHLGARATETELKALSAAGNLSDYRLVHFATHGILSGEIEGGAEPGLILTPPSLATEIDDGYLTASEIAQLKLDADWVILSACNTAGGGERGAEPLSGLARAFFYAGARALLVSHWSVDSDATVKLITLAVGAMARSESIGRAEALRRAMLAMIAAMRA